MNGDKKVAPAKVIFIQLFPTFFLYKVLNFHVVIVIDTLFMFFLLLLCLENSPILNFVKYLLHLIV